MTSARFLTMPFMIVVLSLATAPAGEPQREWTTILGTKAEDAGIAVAANCGRIVVVGKTMGDFTRKPKSSDVLVAAYSPDGRSLWRDQWGGERLDQAHAVAIDRWGRVWVTGYTKPDMGVEPGPFLLCYSADGRLLKDDYCFAQSHSGYGIGFDRCGNVIVVGILGSSFRGFFKRFTRCGDVLDDRVLPFNIRTLVQDGHRNIYVAGFDNRSTRYRVAKLDSRGNQQWINPPPDPVPRMRAFGLAVDLFGHVFVTGSVIDEEFNPLHSFVARHDACGNCQRVVEFGNVPSVAHSVVMGRDGCLTVHGIADRDGDGSLKDLFLTRFSPSLSEGPSVWITDKASKGTDANRMAHDPRTRGLYVAGTHRGGLHGEPSIGLLDALLIKYRY